MHFLQSSTALGFASWLLTATLVQVSASPLAYNYLPIRAGNGTSGSMSVAAAGASVADSTNLKTWYHSTGEVNTKTPVKDGNVRQSHKYSIQVATGGGTYYDSFVYESIPRNGNGNICKPGDLSSVCNTDDQITIEPDIGVSMAWTQFLYGQDASVKVTRTDGGSVDPSNVVIRPTNLGFKTAKSGSDLIITVPYSANGYRFSVEFKDDLFEYHNANGGLNSHYVQNKNPSGANYVSAYTSDMPLVGVEPTNALLIFASAFPSSDMVPTDGSNVFKPKQGLVSGLDSVSQSVVWFEPGVYYMTGSAHAKLSSSVSWVYFAPGSYVKGAIEWTSQSKDLRATGFGVLSGEQYVYQANTAQGYQNVKSDDTSLKMWRGESADGMTWTVSGVTVNAPPFNSMDFYGNVDTFSVQASDYKQVGAFFGQTDGMEMYPNSHVHDCFYHVGDDGIKTYYSNVLVERMIVWKTNNAPIVQFGWYSRNLDSITIDSVDVIHTRYISQATPYPRALVASAASYLDLNSQSDADTTKHLSNYMISNWRCEGVCPALMGINPLENVDTLTFKNIHLETMSPATTEVGTSTFRVYTDSNNGNKPIALGDNSPNKIGLSIQDFYVGSEKITLAGGNAGASGTGRLNIDQSYSGRWECK